MAWLLGNGVGWHRRGLQGSVTNRLEDVSGMVLLGELMSQLWAVNMEEVLRRREEAANPTLHIACPGVTME